MNILKNIAIVLGLIVWLLPLFVLLFTVFLYLVSQYWVIEYTPNQVVGVIIYTIVGFFVFIGILG